MERWTKIFYATVWIEQSREFIQFMFRGKKHKLSREEIAEALGVPGAEPPRCALVGGVLPPFSRVNIYFCTPFRPESSRAPDRLTMEAKTMHKALRHSLLPRMGAAESLTSIQQWLLLHIISHTPFDIVDFLIREIEDCIADGLWTRRQQPYAHIISYLLDRAIDESSRHRLRDRLADRSTAYMVYRPPTSTDPRRGPRALVVAQHGMTPEERDAAIEEDDEMEDLDAVHGLWDSYSESDDSDSDYEVPIMAPPPRHHNGEAGGSGSAPAAASAPDPVGAPTQAANSWEFMISMQKQMVNMQEQMLKMQEVAEAREERNNNR